MKYKNAKTMIPEWLLEQLQDYIQGEIIYIPRKEAERAGWGQSNGTRNMYMERNTEIRELYRNGTEVGELSDRFCLTEYSIRKILRGVRCNAYALMERSAK